MILLQHLLNAPRRVQVVAAIGFAVLAAVFAGWAIVVAVDRVSAMEDALRGARERAGRLIALAEMPVMFSAGLTSRVGTAGDHFMTAANLAVARAELQQRVDAIATAKGAFVTSAANLADLAESGATQIGLRIDFSGSDAAVVATILAIEQSLPLVVANRLSIHSTQDALLGSPAQLAAELHVYVVVRLVAPLDSRQKLQQ